MFAAVSDQLLQRDGIKVSGSGSLGRHGWCYHLAMQVEVELLRSQCADYIQQHHKELMPFLLDPDTGDTLSDGKHHL